MKTMCENHGLSGYHQNAIVTTHSLWHMEYDYTLLVPMNQECSTSKARSLIQLIISNDAHSAQKPPKQIWA